MGVIDECDHFVYHAHSVFSKVLQAFCCATATTQGFRLPL